MAVNPPSTQDPWSSLQRDRHLLGRVSAVGEPLCLLLGGILVARIVFRALGLADADAFLFSDESKADFTAAAAAEASWHFVRYGILIGLFGFVGFVRGRRSARSYGVTTGGHTLGELISIGLIMGIIVHIPTAILLRADALYDLGAGTPFWALMERTPWDTSFWLFMFVSSFGIVPFVEEATARGYVLGRLRESFSPGGALLLMAVMFALAHGQYHQANALAVGMLLVMIFGSTVWGYSVYRTGSLIPPIVAHMYVNIPTTDEVAWFALGVSFVVLLLFRQRVHAWALGLMKLLVEIDDMLPLLVAIASIAATLLTLRATPWAPYCWLAAYVGALVISLARRSVWRQRPHGVE